MVQNHTSKKHGVKDVVNTVKKQLDNVRPEHTDVPCKKMVLNSMFVLALSIMLGAGSKALDETAVNALPSLFQYLDITNFLGRFSIWIFIAVCISVYSHSAKRAAFNVFLFFAGMVSSYYLYSAFIAGFFPKTYALIWICITILSPLPAFLCWYAKGNGWFAICISGIIIGVLFSQAVLLLQGIRISHITEVIVWLASLFVLRRRPKEFVIEIGISLPVAISLQLLLPSFAFFG